MMSGGKLDLERIRSFYGNKKTLLEAYKPEPKTRVELRMNKASAAIRSSPDWASNVHDEATRQEWTAQAKARFSLLDKEVQYVLMELEYYALLKTGGRNGDEHGGINMVWIRDAAVDDELVSEFRHNAAKFEYDHIVSNADLLASGQLSPLRVLVDPFLFAYGSKESLMVETPIETPKDSLDGDMSRTMPATMLEWSNAINVYNENLLSKPAGFDKRIVAPVLKPLVGFISIAVHTCWLPTDLHVNEDGSVTVKSYINNLHPVKYADLYKSISNVFANIVPLLEQVTTDAIYPCHSRPKYNKNKCFTNGGLEWKEIKMLVASTGGYIPEEYKKFVKTHASNGCPCCFGEETINGVTYDKRAIKKAWADSLVYSDPDPLPFAPSARPITPYSMRGMPLQASVEMFTINLTPRNPEHMQGRWEAVGRAEERIYAVGLYFYDVENITSSELLFRDPWTNISNFSETNDKGFAMAHDIELDNVYTDYYTQTVGGVEIKNGRYICYQNIYRTMLPTFKLADPTRPGHVKATAFYIVDPSTRQISTEMVPPQQSSWANDHAFDKETDLANYLKAKGNRDILCQAHADRNQDGNHWL